MILNHGQATRMTSESAPHLQTMNHENGKTLNLDRFSVRQSLYGGSTEAQRLETHKTPATNTGPQTQGYRGLLNDRNIYRHLKLSFVARWFRENVEALF
ncbi:hypothetical protein TNCV_4459961 [Trichonephila clavipes]|nr:hypothetical protein TNCV_4459961 [Trichonephila clavipes]